MTIRFTPEIRLKAQQAKRANAQARRESTLRQNFLDAEHWLELARDSGVRLPPWGVKPTIRNMRQFLHKAGCSQGEYEAQFGKLASFPELNSTWPTRAWAGLVLEWLTESRQMPDNVGILEVKPL